MKKIILCLFLSMLITTNVFAEEIQLTDYNYMFAKRMLDGYSTVAYTSSRFTFFKSERNKICVVNDKVEEGYLKPDGTQLYCPTDFSVQYGFDKQANKVKIRQCKSGDMFEIYTYMQAFKQAYFYTLYFMDSKGRIVTKSPNVIIPGAEMSFGDYPNEYLKMNKITLESECDRVDRSYSFREKKINGETYYALFKELKDGETAEDFVPKEKPTDKYTDYINQMYKSGLLFNNDMCFYKRGITRLDFGIVLGRAYCDAVGYSIDRFTSDTHFRDVNSPYCLYLSDNGILTSTDALGYNLYINEKDITKKEVSDALDRAAEKCGVLTEWNSIRVIQPSYAPCSRELAYVETFRLYDLIKQKNAANYVKFTPSQALNSDSDAEPMHYETVVYGDEENSAGKNPPLMLFTTAKCTANVMSHIAYFINS